MCHRISHREHWVLLKKWRAHTFSFFKAQKICNRGTYICTAIITAIIFLANVRITAIQIKKQSIFLNNFLVWEAYLEELTHGVPWLIRMWKRVSLSLKLPGNVAGTFGTLLGKIENSGPFPLHARVVPWPHGESLHPNPQGHLVHYLCGPGLRSGLLQMLRLHHQPGQQMQVPGLH